MSLDQMIQRHMEEAARLKMVAAEVMILQGCHHCGKRIVEFNGGTPVKALGNRVVFPDGVEYPLCFECLSKPGGCREP